MIIITVPGRHVDPDPFNDGKHVWYLEYRRNDITPPVEGLYGDAWTALAELASWLPPADDSDADPVQRVISHFRHAGADEGYLLQRQEIVYGSQPAQPERMLPHAIGELSCPCGGPDGFMVTDRRGQLSYDPPPRYRMHMSCGRVVDTDTGWVVYTLATCSWCQHPIVEGTSGWEHVVGANKTRAACTPDPLSQVATPAGYQLLEARRAWPMAGDCVMLTADWAGARAGDIGVIDGYLGQRAGKASITWNASVHCTSTMVRCSGGPATIETDLAELVPTTGLCSVEVWDTRGSLASGRAERVSLAVEGRLWHWTPPS